MDEDVRVHEAQHPEFYRPSSVALDGQPLDVKTAHVVITLMAREGLTLRGEPDAVLVQRAKERFHTLRKHLRIQRGLEAA